MHVKTGGNSTAKNTTHSYQWSEREWEEQQREYAKARAREHARMRYEEFVKSDYYKEQVVFDIVTLHIGILISIILLLVFPFVMILDYGQQALLPIIVVNFVLIPFHLRSYFNLKKVSLRSFKSASIDIVKITYFQITVLTVINLYSLFSVGLHTLISPIIVVMAYLIVAIVVYLLSRKSKFKTVLTFGTAPLIISTLFLLNYYFSSNEAREIYTLQTDYPRMQDDTYINLEDDIYEEFPGLRIFSDFDEVQDAIQIEYTIKDGWFGIRVMTDYRFIKRKPRSETGFDVDY